MVDLSHAIPRVPLNENRALTNLRILEQDSPARSMPKLEPLDRTRIDVGNECRNRSSPLSRADLSIALPNANFSGGAEQREVPAAAS
jgi:hypothetical protein